MPAALTEFEVDGVAVDLAAINIEPVQFRHQFGAGAALTLRQIDQHHRASLSPGARVVLRVDGVPRLVGRVRSVQRAARGQSITYIVRDALARAAGESLALSLAGGTVGQAVAASLAAVGWVAGPSVEALASPSMVSRRHVGTLGPLLTEIMQNAPEHRLQVDPAATATAGVPTFRAVQVYDGGDVADLRWGGPLDAAGDAVGRIMDVQIGESVDGAFTAVEIIQPEPQFGGTGLVTEVADLNPGWNAPDEGEWTIEQSGATSEGSGSLGQDPESSEVGVFRLFRIPNGIQFDPNTPWKLMIRQPANRRRALAAPRWFHIDAEYVERADQEGNLTAYIMARHPVTVSGDVRARGRVTGPTEARLLYERLAGGGAVPPTSARWPAQGFAGEAFDRFGVEVVRRVEVTNFANANQAEAERIHAALSGVRRTGQIGFFGRPPAWSWDGSSSVRLSGQDPAGVDLVVDYQGQIQTVTGIRLDFAADLYEVDVTTDRESFTRLDLL